MKGPRIDLTGRELTQELGLHFIHVHLARMNFFPHLNLVFVHMPKTAGTSVHRYLAELDLFARLRGARPAFPLPDVEHYKHATARAYRDHFGADAFERVHRLCVVRNPWDQMVSSYEWWLQHAAKHPGHRETVERVRALGSFRSFIEDPLGGEHINECRGHPQDWYLDERGVPLVDHFVRFEHIETELPAVMAGLCEVPAGISLEHRNATKRAHYRDYYDERLRRLCQPRFETIARQFGYHY